MSQSIPEKAIAPKRQRMLDMILALGGLKEESAIPLSRVKEELDNLKVELAPLTDTILAFPDSYYGKFLEAVEKSNMVVEVSDKGILKESISNLGEALSKDDSESLKGLNVLLTDALDRMTEVEDAPEAVIDVDMTTTLSTISSLISEIELTTEEFEKSAESVA